MQRKEQIVLLYYKYRWTDTNGIRHTVYADTLNELRRKEDQISKERIEGICRSGITVAEQVKMYLEVKANLKNSTFENYHYYEEHCIRNSDLGHMRVMDVRKTDVLRFYKYCSKELKYANGTIAILQKILHPAFQLAVDDNILRNNPTQGCLKDYPVEKETKYALTQAEEQEFVKRLKDTPYAPLLLMMIYMGLRISELLGIRWQDIDLKNRTISINHQLLYRKKDGKTRWYIEEGTKNGQNRTLELSQKAYECLKKQQEFWMKCKKDADYEVDGYKNFVFISKSTGRPVYPGNVRRMLNDIVAMNDKSEVQLPPISPHILRHSFCTRLVEAGLDPKAVQYFMGHRDLRTTMEIYTHVNKEQERASMEKLNEFQRSYAK